ncbi:ScyD/ScyE family protein [Georgenia daeguensis]|uniref:ScyD/ScyE family protein n=1 Tax=Georgenia daeguensis TaxID=908355 RepID=A0ABP8EQ79_9MICO
MRPTRLALPGAAAALLIVPLVGVGPSVADGHDDDHDEVTLEDRTVLVRTLDNPRGITVDRSGDVFVAQAGEGRGRDGRAPCFPGPEGDVVCLGATGEITELHMRGHTGRLRTTTDVVKGLPSIAARADGSAAIGPSDVDFDRNRLFATIGLGADPAVRDRMPAAYRDLADKLATVHRFDLRRGTATKVADIGDYERTTNPEKDDFDTNPNSLVSDRRGHVVVDAGGNALLHVDNDGDISTTFVFPKEAAVSSPMGRIRPDAVPTTVVKGPDDAYYVSQLTGFPFVKGTATVWRFERGEDPEVFADGFTNVIDLAFTDDEDLLVLEIATNGLASGDPKGALHWVDGDDTDDRKVLTTNLTLPGGLALDGDHVYVSNKSAMANVGEVLRFTLDD